jgi:hypothetical protein
LAKSQDSAKLISYELRNNEDVFMEEGPHDASALQFACEELPSDKQVVMDSVRQDGYGFGEELRSDSEVVMEGKQHRAFVRKSGQFWKTARFFVQDLAPWLQLAAH